MVLSKALATAVKALLPPGHYVLHVNGTGVSVQPVVADAVLDDKSRTVASLLNLSLMCEQVPHA
jgi:hypothetical protein